MKKIAADGVVREDLDLKVNAGARRRDRGQHRGKIIFPAT